MRTIKLSRLFFLVCATIGAIHAQEPEPAYVFSHLAGSTGGYGNVDGTGAAARFWNPSGTAFDRHGNLYVTDSATRTLRKVTPAGEVTTLLTSSSYKQHGLSQRILNNPFASYEPVLNPGGVAVDSSDNIYLTDPSNHVVLKLTPQGNLSVFAGETGITARLYHYADGPGDQARFDSPFGLAIDRADNLYVADQGNHIIRKITPAAIVSTFAGMPPEFNHPQGRGANRELSHSGSADGTGTAAQFNGPSAIVVDAGGTLFVTDEYNHTIRKITSDGTVTTLAGTPKERGSTDGVGSVARFNYPRGITVDATGTVYVADLENAVIRRILPSGEVTTIAGKAGELGTTDGSGGSARFIGPRSMSIDAAGNIIIGDGDPFYYPQSFGPFPPHAGTIRRLGKDGNITTFVGKASERGSADGVGSKARFTRPEGVAVDAAGNVYVADRMNHIIRKITSDGTTTTLAGAAGQSGAADGVGAEARFNQPTGVAVDAAGNVYVADNANHVIRKITPAGVVSTLAGQSGTPGSTDGSSSAARFHNPLDLCVDATGNLYVTDGDYFPMGGDPLRTYGTVRRITPDGTVSTIAGNPVVVYDGQQYIPANNIALYGGPRLGRPDGIAIDSQGNIFVADSYLDAIFKINGNGKITAVTDAKGEAVFLNNAAGLAIDAAGNLLVTCSDNYNTPQTVIKRITPEGVVTTIAGTSGIIGSADGVGGAAHFNMVLGLAIDAQGRIYAADAENNAIRLGRFAGSPLITAHPQSRSVTTGGQAQFTVTASGNPEPIYQWYFNGTAINSATSSTLTISNAQAANAGDYTVVVSNALGSVTSEKATLTVTAPPASGGSVSSGGGGGGSPSLWFLAVLSTLGIARRMRKLRSA